MSSKVTLIQCGNSEENSNTILNWIFEQNPEVSEEGICVHREKSLKFVDGYNRDIHKIIVWFQPLNLEKKSHFRGHMLELQGSVLVRKRYQGASYIDSSVKWYLVMADWSACFDKNDLEGLLFDFIDLSSV